MQPLVYKGYIGSIIEADGVFYVEVLNTKDMICTHAQSKDGLPEAFKKLIDDYLEFKKAKGLTQ